MQTSKSQAGKGDKPRPKDQKKWDEGWTRIWGTKQKVKVS